MALALKGGEKPQTQPVKNGPHAEPLAQDWIAKAKAGGWRPRDTI